MDFERLLEVVGDEPVFESSLLLAGDVDAALLQQQLSRWVKAGRVHQVRRGLYALAPPWRKVTAHPFVVSNRLMRGSYVSCEAALSHYGLIPDVAQEVTAVSTGRPCAWATPVGRFRFRHLDPTLLFGYRSERVAPAQDALIATPEKALLDLVHLTTGGDDPSVLDGLRLQNLDRLDLDALFQAADRADRPKLRRAAAWIADLARAFAQDFETL